MNSKFKIFRDMHVGEGPLLLGNVWNVQSAKCFEKAGFKAIGTSSAAVAETLGYTDGEAMSFDEYVFVIRSISKSTSLPLTVDIEGGYGRSAAQITENIVTLNKLGVVGVNIEDSLVKDGRRSINDPREFAEVLQSVCKELKARKVEMFINVRSDAFLVGSPNPLDESIRRLKEYQATGIHGLFFPCATDLAEIRSLVEHAVLPVNIMCMPTLPTFDELKAIGVKRISMGNFLNATLYAHLDKLITETVQDRSFKALFPKHLPDTQRM